MAGVVLALMAHPDDEVLGCGGTLAVHVARGDIVHARFVGTGVGSRIGPRGYDDQEPINAAIVAVETRLSEMRAAATVLGLASVDVHQRPPEDQQFDREPQLGINQRVEAWLRELRPTVIYTHTSHDINRDHQVVAAAVMVATRPWTLGPCTVYGCEIPGCSLMPDVWRRLDVGSVNAKRNALACYRSEIQVQPEPRSEWAVMARLHARGVEAGCDWAEAFEVLREVG